MKRNKFLAEFLLFAVIPFSWAGPQAGNYKIKVSHEPFTKDLSLSSVQQGYSSKWKHIMLQQLAEQVNYAGHYRLYFDYGDDLPNECGAGRPLCGWVIDKITGQVVSELPEFISNENDMRHPNIVKGCVVYSPEDENEPPPSGTMADFPIFYLDSTLLWMNGTLSPASNPNDDKCEYQIYNFKADKFQRVGNGDPSDDPRFQHSESSEAE